MKHGKKFIEEYPEIGELVDRIFIKRELDEWYKKKCAEELLVPSDIYEIRNIKKIEVENLVGPSSEIFIHMQDMVGSDGFFLGQIINVKVSKLVPVYILDYSYTLRHNLIDGVLEIVGSAESLELIQGTNQINRIMAARGYTEISYLYDFYDTVYEWSKLQNIEPFNRRFTLGDALFTDVLELC